MLIIMLLFALIRTLRGVPLETTLEVPDAIPALVLRATQTHFGQRAVNDIIISCFATIFACTWSAVHPNIPAPTDCWWTRFKRQVVTMVYALLAPEAITAWALRQRLAAARIADKYNNHLEKYKRGEISLHVQEDRALILCGTDIRDQGHITHACKTSSIFDTVRGLFQDSPLPDTLDEKGKGPQWSLEHGFFLQMGGFMLCESGRPIQTLGDSVWGDEDTNIIWNIQNGIIDEPKISIEDIQDRSKGDAISKTLIILQTTWFIVQCVARWSTQLPVTELEVVTLGFAMLNGITYWLWWNKPQNVGRPVYLEIKKLQQDLTDHDEADTKCAKDSDEVPITDEGSSTCHDSKESPTIDSLIQHSNSGKKSWLRCKIQQGFEEHASSAPWQLLWIVPVRFFMALIRPLSKAADYTMQCVRRGDLRVPTFYSAEAKNSEVYTATTAIGVAFGSVHLIASWSLDFSSFRGMWLWRVSAFIITIGPIFLGLWQYFRSSSWGTTFGAFLVIVLPLYIISRIVLLVLSLLSLHALPPAALYTLNWTSFIPHL